MGERLRRQDGSCATRSEEHTSELQSRRDLVCRLLLEKKKMNTTTHISLLHYTIIFSNKPRPPTSTLFPYTTLFRSSHQPERREHHGGIRRLDEAGGCGRPGALPDRNDHRVWGNDCAGRMVPVRRDRKSTRLNSSHVEISYAVFCLKKKR